jgi:outer membrane protein OmpA-like peptidoglycan-associated protein
MNKRILAFAVGATLATTLSAQTPSAQPEDVVDMKHNVPTASAIADGLFPAGEDGCAQLKAAGFKCMGFKPTVRYSLPANAFKVGSAEIPDTLKKQLDVFAEVLKAKRGSDKKVRIEGHADASGAASTNLALSQRRAEAVKGYLVDLGAESTMLDAVGMGDKAPKIKNDPFSAENRRVEIGRATPPS